MSNSFVIVLLLIAILVAILIGGYSLLRSRPGASSARQGSKRKAAGTASYRLADIPADASQLSLLYYYMTYRDEVYAMAYLFAGAEPAPRPSQLAVDTFSQYWDANSRAIWAWRNDNISAWMTADQLQRAAQEQFQRMLLLLENNGWKVKERHAPVDDFRLFYLLRT